MTPSLFLALTACVTEVGNPEFEGSMAALARTSAPGQVAVGSGKATVVDEAWVTLREIRFEAADDCDNGATTEADIEGPWTVDLVAIDELPVKLETRSFCRLRLRFDRASGGDLDDLAVRIAGRRTDDTPFLVDSRDKPDLELRAEGGAPFTLDEDAVAVLLAFDVARWLDFDLDALSPGKDGTIHIDDDDNRSALDAFEAAVEDSLELFEDTVGDRVVTPTEPPLATAL